MDIREEILRHCGQPIHPNQIIENVEGDADTIQWHLCRLVEDGLIDADANVVEGMDGDIVSHVHFVYGRIVDKVWGFAITGKGRIVK